MRSRLKFDDQYHDIERIYHDDPILLRFDKEKEVSASAEHVGGHRFVVTVDGRTSSVALARSGNKVFLHLAGESWLVEECPLVGGRSDAHHGEETVTAPMPGTVVSLNVHVGDAVGKGKPLIVIESMKLETTIRSPLDGVVAETPLTGGATFDKGAVLIRLETAEE